MIYKTARKEELVISEGELSRRLNIPRGEFPAELLIYKKELISNMTPSFCAATADVKEADGGIYIGDAFCPSLSLAKILGGCSSAFLLCATLGVGVERLLRKYSLRSPSGHFMIDAAADTYIEALCDRAEEIIFGTQPHTARFSPGYADLPLSFTAQIIRMTNADKLLGVKLGKSFLASPSKTVTAVIGIKNV